MGKKVLAANGKGGQRRSQDDEGEEERRFFLPSASWQGPKRGYYFGTNELGTGYYLDSSQEHQSQGPTASAAVEEQEHQQAKKRQRRTVGFADDRNETALIVSTSRGSALLAQAEQRQGTTKIVALTAAGVQAAATALQKAAEHNALQRAKVQEESSSSAAELYMDSEIALYEHIAALKAFAAEPAALYPLLLSQPNSSNNQEAVLPQLVQLLLHDNVDIGTAVVSVLLEWLDMTDLADAADNDDDKKRQEAAVHQMAFALLDSEGPELLVENLARMTSTAAAGAEEEDEDEVGRGVEDILSLLEQLLELDLLTTTTEDGGTPKSKKQKNGSANSRPSVAATLCRETALVSWLFQQISAAAGAHDGDETKDPTLLLRNRSMELLAYLAPREEIYSIITDWSRIPAYRSTFAAATTAASDNNKVDKKTNQQQSKSTLDGIEILLQSVAAFRKRQPTSEAQVEFLENAAMVLASCLTYSPKAVKTFLEAQGIELVMRCLKERVYAGAVALKWLDFGSSSSSTDSDDDNDTSTVYRHACEELIQAGALKRIFPLFLGRHLPKYYQTAVTTAKQKKEKKEFHHATEATVVRILYALVRYLRDDSPHDAKERLLAKFVGVTSSSSSNPDDNDKADNNSSSNEKVNRLVELLLAYDQRARLAEYKFYRSDVEEELMATAEGGQDDAVIQLAALDAKLAAGGDVLHRLAAIAAFCCTGSKRCHEQILAQLHAQQSGIGLIREALEEFVSVLGESEQKQQLQRYLEEI